jgi:toxin CcdB
LAIGCHDVVETHDGRETFVVFQSDFLSHLDTRLVIPLLPSRDSGGTTLRLNPLVKVEGADYVLATHLCFSARLSGLRRTGASLAHQHDVIRDALDFLTSGF